MTEHTPTPWRVQAGSGNSEEAFTITTSDRVIASVAGEGYANRQANAAFIVRAANSHAALVAALRAVEWSNPAHIRCCPSCQRRWDGGHAPDCQLDKALRAAEGE
jgi:hypothetical protein